MKIKSELRAREKYRIHKLSGDFDFEFIKNNLMTVYRDPEFDPGFSSIWDLSEVENLQKIVPKEIDWIVSFVKNQRSIYGKIRTAIVVAQKLHFGIARIYELSLESDSNNEVMVFKNIEKAIHWIK